MTWVATAIAGSAVVGAGASAYAGSKAAGASKDATRASIAEQQREYDTTRSDTAPYRQVGQGALGKLAQLYGLGPVDDPNAGPKVGSGQFKPSELVNMRRQGWSLDQILKAGVLAPGQGSKEYRYLTQNGFTPDEINSLQNGTFSTASTGAPGSGANASPDTSVFFASPDYQFNLGEGQKAIDHSLAARGGALSGAGVKEGIRYASGEASKEFGSFYDRLANLAGIGQTGVAQSSAAGQNAANNISASYMQNGANQGSAYTNMASGVNGAIQGGIGNALLAKYLKV